MATTATQGTKLVFQEVEIARLSLKVGILTARKIISLQKDIWFPMVGISLRTLNISKTGFVPTTAFLR